MGAGLSGALLEDVADLLRQVVDEIRGLRQDLATGPRRAGLSRDDLALAGRLLPVVAGVCGSELFSSAELCEHQSPALRLVRGALNAKQVGRLLRRLADHPVGGYLVERQGVEAGAVLWRLLEVPEFPENEKVFVPHAPASRRLE